MWRRRTESSCCVIEGLRLGEDPLLQLDAQTVRGVEIHRPAEEVTQFSFEAGKSKKPWDLSRRELHQYIDVARRREVIPEDGAEEP